MGFDLVSEGYGQTEGQLDGDSVHIQFHRAPIYNIRMGSMTDHARGAGHPKGRAAESGSQIAQCPDALGKPGWKLQGGNVRDTWLPWPT